MPTTAPPAPSPSHERLASPVAEAAHKTRQVFQWHGRYRTLHLTWFAFFLTFVVWFGFAPFATTIGEQFGLDKGQLLTLGLCNVALTVPARMFVGMALDRFGPRRVYASILCFAVVPSVLFATAQSFEQLVLARLLVSLVGAGFVVGIRMVSEWFDEHEVGTAEGVYGGWGNFGAAAAAFGLPAVAALIGGPEAWRWAAVGAGVGCALYGLAYLRLVTDTPPGREYVRPKTVAALQVTSRGAVFGLVAMLVPLSAAVGIIVLRIWDAGVVTTPVMLGALAVTAALLVFQASSVFRVNRVVLAGAASDDPFPLRSVAVLAFAYLCTFGSELAAVSFLPQFFGDTWKLGPEVAGLAAAGFAVMNLVSRPMGGLLSDVLSSRRRWLALLLGGLAIGFIAMSRLDGSWPLPLAIGLVVVTSLFAQAGNGAVYAIVPLVRPKAGGQIAGIVGAYGNVGGIVFLASLTVVAPSTFFLLMAGRAAFGLVACRWLVEPNHSHAAVRVAPSARLVHLEAAGDGHVSTVEVVIGATRSSADRAPGATGAAPHADPVLTPLDHWLADQRTMTPVERFSRDHDHGMAGVEARWRDLLPVAPPGPGEQYAFEVDLDACTGCKSCVTACHSLNGLDEHETWRSVGLLVGGPVDRPLLQHVTTACHHCLDPACLSGCPVDAYEKDPITGIVAHLDDQCIGCRYCTLTCPYEVPQYHEELGIVRKCDLCADRLAEGEAPACAQACPTHAITVGVVTLDDIRDATTAEDVLVPTAPSSAATLPTTRYRSTSALGPGLRPADEGEVVPAHAHPPLVAMLVLTQLAVGLATMTWLLRILAAPELGRAGASSFAVVTAVAGLVALGASVLHLGRPHLAWRAVLGVGHSWLSREIVVFGAFGGAAVLDALAHVAGAEQEAGPFALEALDVLVVVAGLAGVACSAAVYAVTGKRWWRFGPTMARFTATTVAAGSATAATGLAILVAADRVAAGAARPAVVLLVGVALALLGAQLALDVSVVRHRRRGAGDELARTARLLTGPLRPLVSLRLGLGATTLLLALVTFALVLGEGADAPGLAGVLLTLTATVVGSELVARHTWFLAVSGPRMPGAPR